MFNVQHLTPSFRSNGTVEFNEFLLMMNRYSEKTANCPDAEMLEAFKIYHVKTLFVSEELISFNYETELFSPINQRYDVDTNYRGMLCLRDHEPVVRSNRNWLAKNPTNDRWSNPDDEKTTHQGDTPVTN
ncbi:hypothetical protein ACTXT7_010005 [Hymenolepis weldensis]